MSDVWTDLISSNPAHGLLAELERTTDEGLAIESLPESAIAYLRRIDTVVANIRERLTQMPPALVSATALNNAVPSIQNAMALIRSFIGDRNEGSLQTANTHVDNLVTEFRWLTPLSHKAESRVLLRSAERFAESVDAREAGARRKLDELKLEIDAAAIQAQENLESATRTLDALKAAGEASAAANLGNNTLDSTVILAYPVRVGESHEDANHPHRSDHPVLRPRLGP